MKRADLFIQTLRHMLDQGPSIKLTPTKRDPFECAYRSPEGGMCAVGYWIPDEIYSNCIEGQSLSNILRGEDINAIRKIGFPELSDYLANEVRHHYPILRRLQEVHDYTINEEGTEFSMREFKHEALKAAEELGIDLDLVRKEFA